MTPIRISFTVPATAGVGFEIDAAEWDSIDAAAKETIMLLYAYQANNMFGHEDERDDGVSVGCYIHRADHIDPKTVDVERYTYDAAAYEEGCRYERAFGDRSDIG